MSYLLVTNHITSKEMLNYPSPHLGNGDNNVIDLLRLLGTVMKYASRVLTVSNTEQALRK